MRTVGTHRLIVSRVLRIARDRPKWVTVNKVNGRIGVFDVDDFVCTVREKVSHCGWKNGTLGCLEDVLMRIRT